MCMRCGQGSSRPKRTIPIEASDVAYSHLQPLKKVKEKELEVAIQCVPRTSVRPTGLHRPSPALMANWRWNGRRPSLNTDRVVLSSALSISWPVYQHSKTPDAVGGRDGLMTLYDASRWRVGALVATGLHTTMKCLQCYMNGGVWPVTFSLGCRSCPSVALV